MHWRAAPVCLATAPLHSARAVVQSASAGVRGLRAHVQSASAMVRCLIATVQCLCARMQGHTVPVRRLRASEESNKNSMAGATTRVLRRIDLLRGGRERVHADRGVLLFLRAPQLLAMEGLRANDGHGRGGPASLQGPVLESQPSRAFLKPSSAWGTVPRAGMRLFLLGESFPCEGKGHPSEGNASPDRK